HQCRPRTLKAQERGVLGYAHEGVMECGAAAFAAPLEAALDVEDIDPGHTEIDPLRALAAGAAHRLFQRRRQVLFGDADREAWTAHRHQGIEQIRLPRAGRGSHAAPCARSGKSTCFTFRVRFFFAGAAALKSFVCSSETASCRTCQRPSTLRQLQTSNRLPHSSQVFSRGSASALVRRAAWLSPVVHCTPRVWPSFLWQAITSMQPKRSRLNMRGLGPGMWIFCSTTSGIQPSER